jgi:acyl carrier protein
VSDINEIQEKILGIVNLNIENAEIKPDQSEVDLSTIGMDSITFIRIVVTLEEAFNIEIPDEFLLITEMNTVEKMTNVVLSAMTSTELTIVQE